MNSSVRKLQLSIFILGMVFFAKIYAADLAPPKFSAVDEFGVNVMSGQVTSSLNTVAIGGALGLSHSISGYTNHFSMTGLVGYQDKYFARSRLTTIEDRQGYTYLQVIRIHDFEETVDFKVMVNGVAQVFNSASPTPVSTSYYQALGDTRHTLKNITGDATHIEWTKPNGTVVRFFRGVQWGAWSDAQMEKVTFPNGLIYSIQSGLNVTTNTGFGLKYIYVDDSRPMTKTDHQNTQNVPQQSPLTWSRSNPKYIQAVNFSTENCVGRIDLNVPCSNIWPKATFTWPGGMPRSIYFDDSTFAVEDAQGGVTEYYFRGFDLAYADETHSGILAGQTPGQRYSPRLIGIKPAGSSNKTVEYTFKTDVRIDVYGGGYVVQEAVLASDEGIITGANGIHGGSFYDINRPYYADLESIAGGNVRRVLPNVRDYRGTVKEVRTKDGLISYENNFRNFPVAFGRSAYINGLETNIGASETYYYDNENGGRGNLYKIRKYAKGIYEETIAQFPATCTNPKTCNQAIWIKDPKGNQTDYTYHTSGQVETVTLPPNKNGVRAKTTYLYTQLAAKYYNASGTKITDDANKIWLKTAEFTCVNSTTCTPGTADEVRTTYEYNSDNLFLTGSTVTAADTNGVVKTLRTCYRYDNNGNQISKTLPRAGLTSCN